MSKPALAAIIAVVLFVVTIFVLQASRGLANRADEASPAAEVSDTPRTSKPSGFWSTGRGYTPDRPYQTGKLIVGVGIVVLMIALTALIISKQRKRGVSYPDYWKNTETATTDDGC